MPVLVTAISAPDCVVTAALAIAPPVKTKLPPVATTTAPPLTRAFNVSVPVASASTRPVLDTALRNSSVPPAVASSSPVFTTVTAPVSSSSVPTVASTTPAASLTNVSAPDPSSP